MLGQSASQPIELVKVVERSKARVERSAVQRPDQRRQKRMSNDTKKPNDNGQSPFAASGCYPAVAISVRQPWAWLILHAGKDIENRTWPTRFRGRVAIHASKGMTRQEYEDAMNWIVLNARLALDFREPKMEELQRGGIVGEVNIVDCVTASKSPWFVGEYGFVLRDARPLPFLPCKGSLGFFKPDNEKS